MEKQKKSGGYEKPRKNMGFPRKYLEFMENPGKIWVFKLDENEEDQVQFLELIVVS